MALAFVITRGILASITAGTLACGSRLISTSKHLADPFYA
jgi:hypothetical protein